MDYADYEEFAEKYNIITTDVEGVSGFGYPCTHVLFDPESVIKAMSRLLRIVSELECTEDGVPITPETALFQKDGFHKKEHPWNVGKGWSFQRLTSLKVYSTPEAAIIAHNNNTHKVEDP